MHGVTSVREDGVCVLRLLFALALRAGSVVRAAGIWGMGDAPTAFRSMVRLSFEVATVSRWL